MKELNLRDLREKNYSIYKLTIVLSQASLWALDVDVKKSMFLSIAESIYDSMTFNNPEKTKAIIENLMYEDCLSMIEKHKNESNHENN